MWFYSLLSGFIQNKDRQDLWTGPTGTLLLSEVIRTLAIIVEFSGVRISEVLAKDLFEVSWPLHNADIAEVRLSALIAFSTAITTLPEDKILQLLLDSGGSTAQIMMSISSSDPSRECRSLAQAISTSISTVLEQALITY